MVYQFNPIDGTTINEGFVELNFAIKQISILQPGVDFLRGVMLLDKNNNVHVIPDSAVESVSIYQKDSVKAIKQSCIFF